MLPQACVNQVTAQLQGISNCAARHLRTFDPNLAEELRDRDPVTGTVYLRFDFEANYDDLHNHAGIRKIIDVVKTHGATHLPAAAPAIAAISDADLLKRVQAKFNLMKKQYKERARLLEMADEFAAAAASAELGGMANDWSDDEARVAAPKKKAVKMGATAPKLQSRAAGVC
jgi:hypothetical protein